jgi:sporulation protein YlmC with PRC-barrel domain
VDINWEEGKVTQVDLNSASDQSVTLYLNNQEQKVILKQGKKKTITP